VAKCGHEDGRVDVRHEDRRVHILQGGILGSVRRFKSSVPLPECTDWANFRLHIWRLFLGAFFFKLQKKKKIYVTVSHSDNYGLILTIKRMGYFFDNFFGNSSEAGSLKFLVSQSSVRAPSQL
jgi:hypothetical protein